MTDPKVVNLVNAARVALNHLDFVNFMVATAAWPAEASAGDTAKHLRESLDAINVGICCPKCKGTGIDQTEVDDEGRVTGMPCDCSAGSILMIEYYRKHPEDR